MNYKIFKTDLKPWLKKFFFEKFSYIIKTITGTIISITDGIRKKVNELKLSKESTQETTTGKNLFDTRKTSVTSNGVVFTPNNDGSITIKGTSTAALNVVLVNTNNPPVLPAGTYRKSIKVVGTITKNGSYVFLTGRDNQNSNVLKDTDVASNSTQSSSATLEEQHTMSAIGIWSNEGGVVFDCTIYVQIEQGSTATEWEKYTGGIPAPNPDYPMPVNVVTGYRNLFDKDNNLSNGFLKTDGTIQYASNYKVSDYIDISNFINVTISGNAGGSELNCFYDENKVFILANGMGANIHKTITVPTNAKYLRCTINNNNLNQYQVVGGVEELPYVPYGTNWIYTAISNGTDTNYYTIPLNDNEIAGIGDYEDEIIVDKFGKCYLNKKTGKVVLDGTENINTESSYVNIGRFDFLDYTDGLKGSSGQPNCLSNYYRADFSTNDGCIFLSGVNANINIINKAYIGDLDGFKSWLAAHNTDVYYALTTPQLIDLNYTVDLTLFEGINNISNSEDMDMEIKYYSK